MSDENFVKTCPDKTLFKTLDGIEIILDKEDLMICDTIKPLCIAGVFGGLDSGVTDTTTSIFLESAYFDPISVRKTSKRHGLNTDASFRFERGIDPEMVMTALKRAANLIKNLSGGTITSNLQSFNKQLKENSQIFLSYEAIERTIGESINEKDLNIILNALEIKINNFSDSGIGITIPHFRVDVTRPADVIEEILRVYGYNNIKEKPLQYEANPPYKWNDSHKLEAAVANKLTGNGFMETINNSLTSPDYTADFYSPITLVNPLGNDLSNMRQSLIFNALEVISFNLNRQNKNLKIFEFGTIYGKKKDSFIESKRLSISTVGSVVESHWENSSTPSNYFYGKGVLNDLLESLGLSGIEWQITPHPHFDEAFNIIHQKKNLGTYGLVSKSLNKKFGISQNVYLAELNWNVIVDHAYTNTLTYEEVAKYPMVKRDFALLLDESTSFEDLQKVALNTNNKILKEVHLFDVYKGKTLDKGKKSYGLSFTFQDKNKTLTDKQVDRVMKELQKNFEKEFDSKLR
jgi:phenylalanyl-tRNA synthetase beta chain